MANWNVIRSEQGSIPTDCGLMYFVKVYVSDQLTQGAQFSNIDLPSSVFSGKIVSFFGSSNAITPFNAKRVKTEISGTRFYVRYYDAGGILRSTENDSISYLQDGYASVAWAVLIDPNGNAIKLPSNLFRSTSSLQKVSDNTSTQLGTMRVNRSWYISGTMVIAEADLAEGSAILLSEPPQDPYGYIPESTDDGGLGNGDYSNDDTDFSGLPTLSSSQVGFCSLYKMTQQQMADLADYLWGLSTGTIATFLPVFSNPMDCIIAVGIVPVEPEVESQDDLIKVGNLTTTVWARRITKQYDEIDMGEVEIGKGDFTNSFMDYSPYTKVELYLPYIGNVSLDTDEVMDSTVRVKYKFDLLSGSCVAEVKVTKTYNYQDEDHVHSNILYRYSGNFLANIPINGENFSQMFNAVIGAVAMGINAAGNYKTGIASADMAKSADVSSARSDAASLHRSAAAFNGVGATSAMKPSIQRAGNVSSVCGFLSKQKPEIILKLPKIANIGANQGHEVGYPRYGEYTIAELEGYSSIMMIHLKNIPCTDTERSMIENDLNAGVIFSNTAVPQHSEFQNTVKVYKFKCENICVNKADDWELIDTLTVAWRNPDIDVLNPTIRIEATSSLTKRRILREGNYVYIADFERYYYVKSVKAQAGNFIELGLEVDACMSWLTNLRNQQCVVDRQEKVWNTYLNDEFMRVYNTPYTVVKEFPNGFSTQNFVLAVAGGGSSNSSSS